MRVQFRVRKENVKHENRYHKFAISHEETGFCLTFSFTFFFYDSIAQFLYKQNPSKKKIKIIQKPFLVHSKAKNIENFGK